MTMAFQFQSVYAKWKPEYTAVVCWDMGPHVMMPTLHVFWEGLDPSARNWSNPFVSRRSTRPFLSGTELGACSAFEMELYRRIMSGPCLCIWAQM